MHKKAEPYRSKIHLESGVWTYRVTSQSVSIREPSLCETHRVPLTAMLDMSWDEIDRAKWKGGPSIGVTPSMVKTWILANKADVA